MSKEPQYKAVNLSRLLCFQSLRHQMIFLLLLCIPDTNPPISLLHSYISFTVFSLLSLHFNMGPKEYSHLVNFEGKNNCKYKYHFMLNAEQNSTHFILRHLHLLLFPRKPVQRFCTYPSYKEE